MKLINFSNHPMDMWSSEQIKTALKSYDEIIDIPFPNIDPKFDETDIINIAEHYINKICSLGKPEETAVHIMGEMCFTYCMITKLKNAGYICLASTTYRICTDLEDGSKNVIFEFVRFRNYI